MSMVQRKYFTEISALTERHVMVTTTGGRAFSGTLVGINPETLAVCLADAKDDQGKVLNRVFLNGHVVAQILAAEKPFDIKALADRLEKVFPTMVKLYEDKGFIWVMDKVKLTEKGVVEGSGPAAERVQKVYEQFIGEVKSKT